MVGGSGSSGGNRIFKEEEFCPIVIVEKEVIEAVGVARQDEGKKKKTKKNSDWHRVALTRLRAHMNIVIRHARMMWFILNMEEKRNYREYYTPGVSQQYHSPRDKRGGDDTVGPSWRRKTMVPMCRSFH
ncbi:hypothetical protein R1flu_004708 [Riccia fluitans]|uniref:Uncharacterized protein n=1 Tax=Riccia fluitans TaxID=41844 RepID=A0ABD1YR24_9MARC